MMDAVNRQPTPAQRWLARLSFVLLGPGVVIVGVFAGVKSMVLLAAGLAGVPAMDWAALLQLAGIRHEHAGVAA
jgi:hypothetical protein